MMNTADAVDLLGYAVSDAMRYHAGELTGEFTIDDVRTSIKAVLTELMDDEPTDTDADAVLAF